MQAKMDPTTPEPLADPLAESESVYSAIEMRLGEWWSAALANARTVGEKVKFDQGRDKVLDQIRRARENVANSETVSAIEALFKELTAPKDGPSLGDRANSALDALDSGLEAVETQASKYFSQVTSMFSSIVSVTPQPQEPETIFSSTPAYGSSRYDSELCKLHTLEEPFLKGDVDGFDVEARTAEISALLKKYPALEDTMNRLVPTQTLYTLFWGRYFAAEEELKESERKRQVLVKDANSDEDFSWDDDEEQS